MYGTLPAILLAAALSGCGSAGNKSMNSYYESAADTAPAESGGGFYAEEEAAAEDYDGGFYADEVVNEAAAEESVSQEGTEVTGQAVSERKLIKKVSLDVETEQFDTLLPSIEKRVTALGGYIEEMSSFSRSDQ